MSLPTINTESPVTPSASTAGPISAASPAQSTVSSNPDPFTYFPKGPQNESPAKPGNWLTDLELMHHYATVSYLTLPRSGKIFAVWQLEVPRLAFTHRFLMHQVLAFSAYHLAYLNPAQASTYSLQASQHQNDAIQGMRTALSQITTENCHAVFASSSIIILSAFAAFSSRASENAGPGIDDLQDVFHLIRGMSGILVSFDDQIQNGPLQDLFRYNESQMSSTLALVCDHLNRLQVQLDALDTDPVIKKLVGTEISSLLVWARKAIDTSTIPELRVTITWPITASAEYLKLVRQRHAIALTLLSCYCVILDASARDYWFTRGWGISTLQDIQNCIDPAWKEVVQISMDLVNGIHKSL
jgi:hypothetical protein